MTQGPTEGNGWSIALRTPQILCFALLMSTFIYAGIIVFMFDQGEPSDLRWVFAGIGLAGAIASFIVPGFLRKQAPDIEAETREEVDPDGQAMFRDAAPSRRVVVEPDRVRRAYLQQRNTPYLLALCLSELPAIMGVLTRLSTDAPLAACLVLVFFSSTLIVLRFPFPKRWRADAEARVGAIIPG